MHEGVVLGQVACYPANGKTSQLFAAFEDVDQVIRGCTKDLSVENERSEPATVASEMGQEIAG